MATASKTPKAINILSTSVSRFGNRNFTVPSKSNPDKTYTVGYITRKTNGQAEPRPFFFCNCFPGIKASKIGGLCAHGVAFNNAMVKLGGIDQLVAVAKAGVTLPLFSK